MRQYQALPVIAVEVRERAEDVAGFLAGSPDLPTDAAVRLTQLLLAARSALEQAEAEVAELEPVA